MYEMFNEPLISTMVKSGKLRWWGHVEWMDEGSFAKIMPWAGTLKGDEGGEKLLRRK